jgi:hypothetical protein
MSHLADDGPPRKGGCNCEGTAIPLQKFKFDWNLTPVPLPGQKNDEKKLTGGTTTTTTTAAAASALTTTPSVTQLHSIAGASNASAMSKPPHNPPLLARNVVFDWTNLKPVH